MDFVLLVTIIIFAIILIAFYYINRIKKTTNPDELLQTIALEKPGTVAYSLGFNDSFLKYRNVSTDQTTHLLQIRNEDHPVDLDGSYIIQRLIGNVKPNVLTDGTTNGFTIGGFPNTKFTCPDGYYGQNCVLNNLCDEGDAGKFKRLTREQFQNIASLSAGSTAELKPIIEPKKLYADNNDDVHPRIRIYCVNDRDYELQVCPSNKILDDATITCKLYDICQDRMNGTKHKYSIGGNGMITLKPNEYYLCNNNESVLTECPTNMIFSESNNACMTESICSGKGRVTLPVDDNNYILCEHDFGEKITCEFGVVRSPDIDELMCKTKDCQPYLLETDNGTLKYLFGRVTCNDRQEEVVEMCDTNLNTLTYNYKWKVPFTYEINDYPSEVYDQNTNVCVTPQLKDILKNPIVSLAWGYAMWQSHPYDILKEEYVCSDDPNAYRWDYTNNVTVPSSQGKLLFTGAPCQTEELVISLPYKTYPADKPFIVMGFLVYIHLYTDPLYVWPVFNADDNFYYYTTVDYNEDRSKLIVTTLTSTIPPQGFSRNTTVNEEDQAGETVLEINGHKTINLIGFGKMPKPTDNLLRQYRYIVSGTKLTLAEMYTPQPPTTGTTVKEIPVIGTVDTKVDQVFAIDWTRILQTTTVHDDLIVTNKSVTINGVTYEAGFTTFRIEKGATFSKIHFRETSLSFSNVVHPQFIFYQ